MKCKNSLYFPLQYFHTHTQKHTQASRQQPYLVSPEVKQPGLRGHNGPFFLSFLWDRASLQMKSSEWAADGPL